MGLLGFARYYLIEDDERQTQVGIAAAIEAVVAAMLGHAGSARVQEKACAILSTVFGCNMDHVTQYPGCGRHGGCGDSHARPHGEDEGT